MKNLLKDMLRPIYHYIKDKNLREFYRLYDNWGGTSGMSKLKMLDFYPTLLMYLIYQALCGSLKRSL